MFKAFNRNHAIYTCNPFTLTMVALCLHMDNQIRNKTNKNHYVHYKYQKFTKTVQFIKELVTITFFSITLIPQSGNS